MSAFQPVHALYFRSEVLTVWLSGDLNFKYCTLQSEALPNEQIDKSHATHISVGVGLFSCTLSLGCRVAQGENDRPLVVFCHGLDDFCCKCSSNGCRSYNNSI